RREDDDQEGPSAGSDRESKRQREEGEHASASTPSEPATKKEPVQSTCQMKEPSHPVFETGADDQPIVQTSQHLEWFSQPSRPPTPDRDWNKSVPAAQGEAQSWISALTTCQMKELSHPVFETGAEDQPIVQTSQHPEWFSQPRKPPTPDRDWNKSLPAAQGNAQSWISALAKQTDAHSSFNELLDTPIDFSNFIMNQLGVDTLTPELLAGRCFKPKIHNICYKDKGGRLWAHKFYGFVVNWESALDVYSKRRIIAVTDLKIVEWHNYKHLDWISVRRDDDKIYKFKEGDFKRLRLQDIEHMLLLLIQGKLSNLTVEERFAFNVSLKMFMRSIVIQRRMEDLQLGVKSYQKRLNLTKPDTYRSDLKRREAYTAYSNPRGIIYQNRDKKNRLMRIDELRKFNDGTLNDVRNALDDRLKG
nr:hypothetical protein [Tanacetum cinerariifolium]